MVNARKRIQFRSLSGFTLIELLVVMAIVALLLTIAMPRYFQNVDKAKEVTLRENLKVMRETIDKFYGDTGRYPNSLDELVEKKYVRTLPMDPITETANAWLIIPPEDPTKGAIYNIKSSASGVGIDGTPYSNY